MNIKYIIVYSVILLTNIQGQSIGVSYESNSFNVYSFFYNNIPARGNIKNMFIKADYPVTKTVMLSFKTGYGWNNYSNIISRISSPSYTEVNTIKTRGIPTEVTLSYYPIMIKDPSFNPYVSMGAGFYSYNTKYSKENAGIKLFEYEYKTKGFCQFVCLGTIISIGEGMLTFIELKHYLNIDLITKLEVNNPPDYFKYEYDYSSTGESLDYSLSIGLMFTL